MSYSVPSNVAPNTVSPRSTLAIAQVASFTVLLVILVYIIGRDASFSRVWRSMLQAPYTWVPLLIFCIVEIIGAALQITTIGNPSPSTDAVGAAICFTIALPLLLWAFIDILHRVNHYAARHHYDDRFVILFARIQQLILLVAIIMYIVGGVRAGNVYASTGLALYPAADIVNMIATILVIVVFVLFLGSVGTALKNVQLNFLRERALLLAILLSTILFIIRLVYAILAHLVGQDQANPVYGAFGLRVGLGFVPEVLITIILICGGLINLVTRGQRLRRRRFSQGTDSTESSTRGTESTTTETTETEIVYAVRR